MTKLRIISDIHYESGLNGELEGDSTVFKNKYGEAFVNEPDCITLVAGDLASSIGETYNFLEDNLKNKQVIFIAGNHIGYNHERKTIFEHFTEYKKEFPKDSGNWHFLENDWMFIPGTNNTVAIIGSEFFTDYMYCDYTVDDYNRTQKAYILAYALQEDYVPIKKLTPSIIKTTNMIEARRLNDFVWNLIDKSQYISPQDYLDLHKLAKQEVIKCYKQIMAINPDCKVILMTHHCLSPKAISPKYKGALNASFTSDLANWVVEKLPNTKLVISGHVHNSSDFIIGDNIRYVVNPCGYIQYDEDKDFNPNFIIDTNTL